MFREYKRDQSLYSLSYFPVDIEFMGSSNVIVNCQNSLSYDDDDDENKSHVFVCRLQVLLLLYLC